MSTRKIAVSFVLVLVLASVALGEYLPADIPHGTVTVDGDLSDWIGADWTAMDQPLYNAGYGPFGYDGNGSIAFQWNDAANMVYVAIQYTDTDRNYGTIGMSGSWRAMDLIEIFWDGANNDADPYTAGPDGLAQHFMITGPQSGTDAAVHFDNYSVVPSSEYGGAKWVITGDLVVLEMGLKPYAIRPTVSFNLSSSGTVGLDVIINDRADVANTNQHLWWSHEGLGNSSGNAGAFTDSTLVIPPVMPIIAFGTGYFSFSGVEEGGNPPSQSLSIWNDGIETLNWQISEDCPWLEVDPNSGSSTGEVDNVVLSVDISGLAPGTYNCELTISSAEAINTPQTLNVSLYISGIIYIPGKDSYNTIQAAIDAAQGGDTVIVSDGTYVGNGNRDLDFGGKAITVRSENGPENCIIDCENAGRGFYFHSGEGSDSIVEGFTITNGTSGGDGGGIYIIGASSPTISNCIVSNNHAGDDGGGIYSEDPANNPTIIDCVISGNQADDVGGGIGLRGGSATIMNCWIIDNSANSGGGINLRTSSPTIASCIFTGNIANVNGGAILCKRASAPTISNCTVVGNTADHGGGINTYYQSDPILTNCIFWDNTATLGSEMYLMYHTGDSMPSWITVSYSDVQGGQAAVFIEPGSTLNWGIGNIDADPNFVEPGNGNYHLLTGSPCIDAGDPIFVPIQNETDIDGDPRIIGELVDMGADERAIPSIEFYCNDFESAVGSEWSNTTTEVTPIGQRGFLGQFGPETATLTLTGMPAHTSVTVKFDLFILKSWDGTSTGIYGPDIWDLSVWNAQTLLHTTFRNFDGLQAYPDSYPGGSNPYQTGAAEVNTLGYLAPPDSNPQDCVYNLSFTFTHSDSSLVLDFSASGLQSISDESWGLDNVCVNLGGVPSQIVYYVNNSGGNDNNNGLSPATAFATIQRGIDMAGDGDEVLVLPGVYLEDIDFTGKAITVKSLADAAHIIAAGSYAVSFHTTEDSNSRLENFVIRGSPTGIHVVACTPTINNVTVVSCNTGILADTGGVPNISNSIFWGNFDDLDGCSATYSCVQDPNLLAQQGNISIDPLFADGVGNDYHLKSQDGRFWPEDPNDPNMFDAFDGLWAMDSVTSPCIDTGDPSVDPTKETLPNGGRINMGAYGNTAYAGKSQWPLQHDSNRDGVVDIADFVDLGREWLERLPWAQ